MGDRHKPRSPLAWQGTLGEKGAHGTRLAQTCNGPSCRTFTTLDVGEMIAKHGREWLLWDRASACPLCGSDGHYMASPGPATPFRPLRTGLAGDVTRARFLAGFKFTKRDVTRICVFAERVETAWPPTPLTDLDVAYAVTARLDLGRPLPGPFGHLGRWADRELLWRDFNFAERGLWERKARGPRSL